MLGRRPDHREPEHDHQLRAARRSPDGVAPAEGVAGLQDEPSGHRVIADPAEVERHRGLRPAAAAGVPEHVDDRARVHEERGLDGNRLPTSDERAPSLELLDGQSDSRLASHPRTVAWASAPVT